MNDQEIVDGIRQGITFYESVLYSGYRDEMLRVLPKMKWYFGEYCEPEDLAHDTFVAVIINIKNGSYEHQDKLFGYIIRTAKYTWLNKAREAKREDKTKETISFFGDIEFPYKEIHSIITRESLEEIDELCRSILIAFYLYNENLESISNEFLGNMDPQNARRRKFKCKEKLKNVALRKYKDYMDNEDLID